MENAHNDESMDYRETISESDLEAKRRLYYEVAERLEKNGDWKGAEKIRKMAKLVGYQIREQREQLGQELFYFNMLTGKVCGGCGEEFKVRGKCWSYGDMSGAGRFPYRVIKRFCSRCFKEEVQLPLTMYAFKNDKDIVVKGKSRDLKIPKWLDLSGAQFAQRLVGGLETLEQPDDVVAQVEEAGVATSNLKGLQLWGQKL